jgi:hypothetical protein
MAMTTKYQHIYQFKVSLNSINPVIWRRIQVPENYSFWDLHVAIQDAMGWFDCHLHEFNMPNPVTGQPERIGIFNEEWDFDDIKVIPGWELSISDYFSGDTKLALYTYDFGDNWEHQVCLEKILPREANVKYPCCIDGARACPPEDCGSIPGYEHLLKIMKDPQNEEYDEMVEWLGRVYDPEKFIPKIRFSSPKRRLKMLLQEK